jgi:DNA processing protein
MGKIQEQAAVLALVEATGGGEWYRTASVIEDAGSAVRVASGQLADLDLFDPIEAQRLAAAVKPGAIERYEELIGRLAQERVTVVTVLDASYPTNLREVYNRPPFLFVKGSLEAADDQAVAIVGTRQASETGLREARDLAVQLARRGVTVLSGLALGVDGAAHRGAIDAGGRTVAVIGTGITRVYPAVHHGLSEEIVDRGAVVSQFWPDAPPTKYSFPMRNAVMSGMGIGTIVIEASVTSGARMQARLALEHGKRLFLMEKLLGQQEWARKYASRPGTTVVRSVEDILRVLDDAQRPVEQLTLG